MSSSLPRCRCGDALHPEGPAGRNTAGEFCWYWRCWRCSLQVLAPPPEIEPVGAEPVRIEGVASEGDHTKGAPIEWRRRVLDADGLTWHDGGPFVPADDTRITVLGVEAKISDPLQKATVAYEREPVAAIVAQLRHDRPTMAGPPVECDAGAELRFRTSTPAPASCVVIATVVTA